MKDPIENRKFRFTMAIVSLSMATIMFTVAVIGCDDADDTTGPFQNAPVVGDSRGQLFETFARNLNELEDYPPAQMLPQLRDYLNQWTREKKPDLKWQEDPAVKSLPEKLQKLPEVMHIGSPEFETSDMEFLMECVWLRDIARRARGDGFDDVIIANRLFDWTVRNLQIEPATADKGAVANQSLSEILLLGRATAMERAWVFIQLCRQQGLDAVMLAISDTADPKKLTPWLAAVRIKNELYLFDPQLGFAIPGPNGKPVAMLAEVAADDSLLRALDLDKDHPYPVKSSDLQSVTALVEASPGYLSRGMKLVEANLAGESERIVLSTAPTTSFETLKKIKHVGDAQLWQMPYEVLAARRERTGEHQRGAMRELLIFMGNSPIYAARIRAFKGDYDGPKGAKRMYLESRPSQAEIDAPNLQPAQKTVLNEIKQAASFWLGLIAFDEKDYVPAIDYFYERVLISSPNGPWTPGARYNLGRAYEATGEIEKAVAQYQLDTSPQSTGNRLRARRLLNEQKAKTDPSKEADKKPA